MGYESGERQRGILNYLGISSPSCEKYRRHTKSNTICDVFRAGEQQTLRLFLQRANNSEILSLKKEKKKKKQPRNRESLLFIQRSLSLSLSLSLSPLECTHNGSRNIQITENNSCALLPTNLTWDLWCCSDSEATYVLWFSTGRLIICRERWIDIWRWNCVTSIEMYGTRRRRNPSVRRRGKLSTR